MIEFETQEMRQAFNDGIREIEKELTNISESRDQIKDIINAIHDATDVPKPMIRKVASLFYKRAGAAFESETSEIKDLYKSLSY